MADINQVEVNGTLYDINVPNGKLTKDKFAAGTVVNDLNSTDADKPLSAAQGKVLDQKIANAQMTAQSLVFDNVPTAGSSNPVTSDALATKFGSVESELTELQAEVFTKLEEAIPYVNNRYANLSNAVVGGSLNVTYNNATGYSFVDIAVKPNDVYRFTTKANTSAAKAYAILDGSNVVLAVAQAAVTNLTLTMPSSAARLIVNTQYQSGVTYVKKVNTIAKSLTELSEKISEKADKHFGKNIINPDTISKGYGISINGSSAVITTDSGFVITDYIPVNGKSIISNAYFTAYWGGAVYDSDKNILRKITTPQYSYQEGDSYIRLTYQSTTSKYYASYGTQLILAPYNQIGGDLQDVEDGVEALRADSVKVGIVGKWIRGSHFYEGTLVESQDYALSGMIPCLPDMDYSTNAVLLNSAINYFDRYGNNLGYSTEFTPEYNDGILVKSHFHSLNNANIAYMRVSHYFNANSSLDSMWVRLDNGVDDVAHKAYESGIVATEMIRDSVVASVEANPYKTVNAGKSLIAFHFDDGEPVISDMVALFHEKNVPLCLAIPGDRLSMMCENSLTIAENCHDMVEDGGEVMTHSIGNLEIDSTDDDIRAFFEWNKAQLINAGFNPKGIVNAAAKGEYQNDPHRLELLKRYAYSTHTYGIHFLALNNVRYNYIRRGLGPNIDSLKGTVDTIIANHSRCIFNGHAPYDVDPSYAVFASAPSVSIGDKYSVDGVDGLTLVVYRVEGNNVYFNVNNMRGWHIVVPTGSGTMTKVSGSGASTLSYDSFYNQDWTSKVGDLIDYIRDNYQEGVDFEFVNTSSWTERTTKSAAQIYFESLT